jgi:hypothetical protein
MERRQPPVLALSDEGPWFTTRMFHAVADQPRRYDPSMRAFSELQVSLLIPLVVALSGASAADGEGLRDTVAVHLQFDTVKPFLNEPSESAKRAIHEHCMILDRRCLEFADSLGELVLATVPDNPDFWVAYDSALAAAPLPFELIEADEMPAYRGFIEGANGWVRRELATRQMADAERLHAALMAHRRRLGLSSILIDKMIFTASTGVLLPAINVHMARRDVQVIDLTASLLDGMLSPLTPDETSLRQIMRGELYYAAARLAELPEADPPIRLEDLQRVYGFVADRSEADWEDFWRNGLDIVSSVELPSHSETYLAAWANYAANLRYLDASLAILRALREVYEGRISPGPPAGRAPYGWSWRWEIESQTMCLDRGYVHASVSQQDPVSVCHPYLGSRPGSQ